MFILCKQVSQFMAKYAQRLIRLLCIFGLASILLLAFQFETWEHRTAHFQFHGDGKKCQEISKELNEGNFNWKLLEENNRAVSPYNFHVKNTGRDKVAIIIPYRDRLLHLWKFLEHIHPIWQSQDLIYQVYVIEQYGDDLFNRGKLLNVGFREAFKDGEFSCVIFHDVDILPESPQCSYVCHQNNSEVKHISAFLDKYEYKRRKYKIRCPPKEYPYDELDNVGGILMMRPDQFKKINGFSNLFWGWGGEDDDLALRIWKKGFSISEDSKCGCCMLKHDHSQESHVKHRLINVSLLKQSTDGLSSLRYEVISKRVTQLHTAVLVDIGSPDDELLGIFKQTVKHKDHCDGMMLLRNGLS